MRGNPVFGQWLRERRAALDMTQDALAREVGCARSTIKKIEIGALRPSRQVAALLAEQLHVAPEHRSAWIQAARDSGDPALASRPADVLHGRLPARIPLVGRDDDLVELCAALEAPDRRLITLTGPPGVGKTRLAVAAAAQTSTAFEDGVYFVALASVTDPAALFNAIGHALGVRETGSATAQAAVSALLRDQRLLLVLDNFEQLVVAAPAVAALLAVAPALTILVTSRVALAVTGEHVYQTLPLTLPALHEDTLAAVASNAAVALFVARAQATRRSFTLTNDNAAVVAALCRRLDGLPLAIELAAARVVIRSAHELLEDLERPLAVLTYGARDLPPRQQTLQEAITWSIQLLAPQQCRLLCALSVFAGAFTLEAAAVMLTPTGHAPAVPLTSIADGLHALVSASLVQTTQARDGSIRFSLLATIRAYAAEQLRSAGAENRLRSRHARYYLALALRASPQLRGANQLEWLRRLDEDHDNFLAALGWTIGTDGNLGASECRVDGVQLAVALWYYWFLRGRLSEANRWLAVAAEPASSVPVALRAEALVSTGVIRYYSGGYAPVGQAPLDGLALARQIGASDLVALAEATFGGSSTHVPSGVAPASAQISDRWLRSCELAEHTVRTHDRQQAACDAASGLLLAEATGDRWLIARLRWALGLAVLDSARPDEAEQHLVESLRLQRELGNQLGVAYALLGLAIVAWSQADPARARLYNEERLGIERRLGNTAGVAHTLASLGRLACAQARYSEARTCLEESRVLYTGLADWQGVVRTEIGLAWIDLECGRWETANARLQAARARAQNIAYRAGVIFATEALTTEALATGDVERAALLLAESSIAPQERGNSYAVAAELRLRGELARQHGRYQDASTLLEQSVERYRSAGHLVELARAQSTLGWAVLDAGDTQRAEMLLTESLACFRRIEAHSWAAWALEGIAAAAAEHEQWEEAVRTWREAALLRERIGVQLRPADSGAQARRQNSILAALGEQAFGRATHAGSQLVEGRQPC